MPMKLLLLLSIGLGLAVGLGGCDSSTASTGPEGVAIENAPDLASADTTMSGAPVDGITCRTSAQQTIKYHIHIHMAIFVNGHERRIPAGAGIADRFANHLANGPFVDNSFNGCPYWLHVHANDGIIHVESPYKHTFTLGQFFDVWQQPLGPDRVGPAQGTVVAFANGRRFSGNPRDLPLLPQEVVQIDVGEPVVAFQPVQFHVNGLCGAGSRGCAA
jgi:hypothetical protein